MAELLLVGDDVPAEHHAGLVTIQDFPLALVVAAYDSQTVGIRVRCNDKVSIELRTELHTEGHSLCILGVRADHRGEVTIDLHLLTHNVDILEAP